MRCASCGFENPEGMQFCEECGTTLVRVCPSCGQHVRPTAKFCGACGTTLGAAGKPLPAKSRKRKSARTPGRAPRLGGRPPTVGPHAAAREAERRQLTVMFCDLVGSTALSEQLDPEEYREVVRNYQTACAEVVSRYEGHIAQYLGDGVLAYFGYPVAHEDDAHRAVRAGLGIIAALPVLSAQLPQLGSTTPTPSLQVRIGIHTGLVVVGEMGRDEYREQMALGETPNLAARFQGLAEPDTIVISSATQQLIAGFFVCQDLGPQTLKGVSVPVRVYRVLGESSVQSRIEINVSMGKLTPLVGRAHEVGLVLERWAAAQTGDGQVVLLSGEPGIGKSRLVQEVKERVVQIGAACLEFRCSPYYQNSAFYPVITHVQRVLHFVRDDTPQAKLAKLEQTLMRYRFPQADTLPLLAALLSLPQPTDAALLNFSPQKQKQKTQEALVAWLVEEAEQQPVYCVWEDLHWADPSTLEFLGLLLDQIPTTRLLMLLTYRPEFTPPWTSRTHLTPLTLARLPRTQAGEMIEKVTGGKPLPVEVQQQIVSKTDGVPLFVEELTKMVLESGLVQETEGHYELTGPLPPLAIPATLHDSLMARLDRLGTAREVAQLGATLGREFSYELLQAVSQVDEANLQQALAKLVEAEVLYQRGLPPQTRYIFKHALIQDAAYQSLLKSKRQQYHQQIAQVLEERFSETKETQPELLAHHYTEASLVGQALPYWQKAGQRAVERSANVEAISHLTKGLELLKTLPDTLDRAQQELTLQITLGAPLQVTKGYAAPEVGAVYSRARELCWQVGETSQLFPALRGLWQFYLLRAELQTAHELGEQLLSLTNSVQDPALLPEIHRALGEPLLWLGEFAPARVHLEQGITLYDPQQHRTHALVYGLDPGVPCLSFAAIALWGLGYPDQALTRGQEALTLAQGLFHPPSLALALLFAAWLHQLRREGQTAREQAEAMVALCTEQGFAWWLSQGTILRGWALAEHGQGEEGIVQIHQGLAAWRVTGAELPGPYYLALLTEAYEKVGRTEEGLAVLAEALAAANNTGERWYEAELYRLKGKLTLQKFQVSGSKFRVEKSRLGNAHHNESVTETGTVGGAHPTGDEEAEACFLKAIDIAQRQSAKSLELRAVMSLSQLWMRQGKKEEARQMLAEIYGWFTEGFDTADLQEAGVLLEELS